MAFKQQLKKLEIKTETIDILISNRKLVEVELGKLKTKSIMNTWLKHLQACAYGNYPRDTILLSRSSSYAKQDNYELSIEFIFLIISSGFIDTFPSCSHSHAAAMEPIILEITKDFVATIVNVAYANRASPVPVLSITFFTKDGRVNAAVLSGLDDFLFFVF